MKSDVKEISPTQKQIDVEIEAKAVKAAYDRISDRYAKVANVPGFRPGHAPRGVVRTRFKDQIRSEVLRELVPDAVQTAIADHKLEPLGEPCAEPINVQDVDVILGGEGVVQDITDNLTGAVPDDEKTFSVSYPPDFTSKGLAGKRVEYTVRVSAVRIKELPELDDEWAQSLGDEIESLEQLRAKVRSDLDQQAKNEADSRVKADLMRALVNAHQFELPERLVNHQTEHHLESVVRDMIGQGIDPRNPKLDWDKARDSLKEQAGYDLRSSLLLERISDEEKIEISDQEVTDEINAIADASRQSPEQVRAILTKQGGERSIAGRLRNRKALDFLVAHANVTEAEWTEEKEESK